MNSLNRRQLILSLFAGTLGAALGGCATGLSSNGLSGDETLNVQERARLAALSITHPDREKEFDEMWDDLYAHTKSIPISDNRIRIRAKGAHLSGRETSEQNFLLRAATETLRSKKDGFVIMHLDYHNDGLTIPSLAPNLSLSSRRWIGNYEDLREDRNEQNMFSSRRKVRKKALDGVIIQMNKDDFPNRERFSASEIYLNLFNYQG